MSNTFPLSKPEKMEKKKPKRIGAGKRTLAWQEDRKQLKDVFEDKRITECELGKLTNLDIRFSACWRDNALGFAHKHKRYWYIQQPELLRDFNEVILACNICHNIIEPDIILTEKVFAILRP